MKPEERSAHERWKNYRRALLKSTTVDLFESDVDQRARIARLKTEPEEFFKYYFPHYTTAPFADFHRLQWKEVISNERGMFCYVIAREHAKSVLHGVMNPIYLMVTGQIKNMLLCSFSLDNAIDLMMPLQLELESNQRLIHDYGKGRSHSRWEDGKFTTASGCSFQAMGSGQSPRGTRNQEARPDYVLLDDFDNDVVCRSKQRLKQAKDWVMGALFPAMSLTGPMRFVMIGNRIAQETVIDFVYEKADHKMQVNLLDDHGVPAWHQRYSVEQCKYMIAKMGERLSQREYFNNPTAEGAVFREDWLQFKALPPLSKYRAIIGYLDPGFKKTATADSKAWILVGVCNAEYHIIRAFVDVASIQEMIGWGYVLQDFVSTNGGVCRLWMEEVFLQSLLYDHFKAEAITKGRPLPLMGDKRKKPDKDARIESMSGLFERGAIYFNEAYRDDHHMIRLREQFVNFQPGVRTKKDGPDAVEGAIHLLQLAIATSADVVLGSRTRGAKHLH